jgi:hypothetical protein
MGIVSVSDIPDGMGLCKENLGDQMIRVHRWFRFNPCRNSGIHHLSPVSEHSGTGLVSLGKEQRSSVG